MLPIRQPGKLKRPPLSFYESLVREHPRGPSEGALAYIVRIAEMVVYRDPTQATLLTAAAPDGSESDRIAAGAEERSRARGPA
jgi:hypothetical protein